MRSESFSFPNSKGNILQGILRDNSSRELFILLHGYKTDKDSKIMIAADDALKKYSSIRLDFSGHGESGGSIDNFRLSSAIDDLKSLFDYISKEGISKKREIYLVGYSLGGAAALLGASTNKKIKGLILIAPPINMIPLMIRKSLLKLVRFNFRRNKSRGFYKDFIRHNIPEAIKNIKIRCIILHGVRDRIVPFTMSKRLVRRYKNFKLIKLDSCHFFNSKKELRGLKESISRHLSFIM